MRFSLLLPTRDRLEYLKLAVETVRRQDVGDWEIVISDNDSAEDIGGYVRSLGDERVRYARTERSLAVTENWSRALAMSTGDYVLMLGDDDGLLPGYLSRMSALIDRFEQPEVIYTGSLVFTYPGVDPRHPGGFLATNTYAEFFRPEAQPFVLPPQAGLDAVRRSMDFNLAFNFNMQLSLLGRPLIERLERRGGVFQSAFPDYYASCAALLEARRVVVDRSELVVIGVTPKSYGFFHVNERETEGRGFLEGDDAVAPQLPGTNINAGWLSAMEALEARFGAEFALRVNRRRHRVLTAAHVYSRQLRGSGAREELAQFEGGLRSPLRILLHSAYLAARLAHRMLPERLWRAIMGAAFGQFPDWEPARDDGAYRDILDVYDRAGEAI